MKGRGSQCKRSLQDSKWQVDNADTVVVKTYGNIQQQVADLEKVVWHIRQGTHFTSWDIQHVLSSLSAISSSFACEIVNTN